MLSLSLPSPQMGMQKAAGSSRNGWNSRAASQLLVNRRRASSVQLNPERPNIGQHRNRTSSSQEPQGTAREKNRNRDGGEGVAPEKPAPKAPPQRLPTFQSNFSVILHRPSIPENIGSTARVMANLGFHRLFIAEPATTDWETCWLWVTIGHFLHHRPNERC